MSIYSAIANLLLIFTVLTAFDSSNIVFWTGPTSIDKGICSRTKSLITNFIHNNHSNNPSSTKATDPVAKTIPNSFKLTSHRLIYIYIYIYTYLSAKGDIYRYFALLASIIILLY